MNSNWNYVPRLATPAILAAAILVSFRYQQKVEPQEIFASEGAPRTIADLQAAYAKALTPGSPGFEHGVRSAPVTILEMSDWGCPYCAKYAREVYPMLMKEYVATGRVFYKQIAFELGMFENDNDVARAAVCASEQGADRFERMHRIVFDNQEAWKSSADVMQTLRTFSKQAGLDTEAFAKCVTSEHAIEQARQANLLAEQLDVNSTPTFFINGQKVAGVVPLEDFRRAIDQLIQQSEAQ